MGSAATSFSGYRKISVIRPLIVVAALALALAIAVAAPMIYLSDKGSVKVIGGISGGLAVLVAGFVAGNVRLACLWGLVITMTLDLSKHFGVLYEKMGGESSFKVEASDPFVLALAFFIGREIFQNRRHFVQIPKIFFLWLFIILYAGLMATQSSYHLTAAHEIFRMCKVITLFVVLTNELTSAEKIMQCAAAMNLAMIAQAAVGLTQYALHRNLGLSLLGEAAGGTMEQLAEQSLEGERAFRAGALMSHPNIFSIFLAVALTMSIAMFMLRIGKFRKAYFLTGAGLGMAALIITLSRSGWLSFSVAFTVLMTLLILHPGLRKRGLMAAILATAALVMVCAVFAGPIMDRIFDSKPGAMISRAEYVRTAKALISHHFWTGSGINTYVWVAPQYSKYGVRGAMAFYKNWYPPVHNIYYLWWSELGLIGLILHLCVWIWAILAAIGNLKVRDEGLFAVNAACLAGLLALCMDGFFSFTFRINSIQRTYWVLVAMVFAVRYWRTRMAREAGRLRELESGTRAA